MRLISKNVFIFSKNCADLYQMMMWLELVVSGTTLKTRIGSMCHMVICMDVLLAWMISNLFWLVVAFQGKSTYTIWHNKVVMNSIEVVE